MPGTLARWKKISVVETLMLVEGDAPSRDWMKFILEANGYRVVEAGHGVEALQALDVFGAAGPEGGGLHLALCSAELPDMTGPEWRAQVRCLAPELPVLLLGDSDWRRALGLAADGLESVQRPACLAVGGLLEKVRAELDERFFARCDPAAGGVLPASAA